jgi:hypothetical protein
LNLFMATSVPPIAQDRDLSLTMVGLFQPLPAPRAHADLESRKSVEEPAREKDRHRQHQFLHEQ